MSKSKKHTIIALAAVVLLICLAGTAYALTNRTIEVSSGVRIYLNDVEFVPRDVNGQVVEAFVYEGTTYLPVRAISEALGLDIDWDGETGSVYLTEQEGSASSNGGGAGTSTPTAGAATVYMTGDISPAGLMALYEQLGREASGNVAVKISTGEPGGTHFLDPALIAELVQSVNGTIVESNTAYGGRRASTAMHYQVAEDHGFTAIAPVKILDEDGEISLPVSNGQHLEVDVVGAAFADYDFHIVLSHFKGHAMAGFGGALKNMSIGYASPSGKNLIHTGGASSTSFMGGSQDAFLEAMAEATQAVMDSVGRENMLYISVMNNLSVDCDCDSNPAAPEIHDIGILASLDPVALDQACIDLIYAVDDAESASLKTRIESRNGTHVLDYAAEIGLGSQSYQLVNID